MSATNRSIIEEFVISFDKKKQGGEGETNEKGSNVEVFDLKDYVVSIDYFEDIFSPAITMKVVVLNETSTNDTAREDPEGNSTDVTPLAIFDGLPIRGGERCKIKILANSQSNIPLDFSTKVVDYLYVTSITNVLRDSKREMFTLHLTSREAFTNETARCYKKYSPNQNIGTTVENILKDTLKVDEDRFKVEPTSNAYGFIGNLRKPFPVITWLAKKSISNSAQGKSSGFLFYQTKTGFKFKSVDTLMRQEYYKLTNDDGEKEESPPFFYSEGTIAYDEDDNPVTLLNDFKILKFSIQKSNDIVKNLKLGVYSTAGMYFNPYNFEFKGMVYKRKDALVSESENDKGNMSLMGSENPSDRLLKLDENSEETIEDTASRIITGVLDIGVLARGDTNHLEGSDPLKFQMQSVTRYNTLFTNILDITIPLNSNLEVGMCIRCEFPTMDKDLSTLSVDKMTGPYIIKELCHHYDIQKSYTSMKILKDSPGDNPAREVIVDEEDQ